MKCTSPLSVLALRIAHACRDEVSQGYKLDLKDVPMRSDEERKQFAYVQPAVLNVIKILKTRFEKKRCARTRTGMQTA
jgi:hypothetical protein